MTSLKHRLATCLLAKDCTNESLMTHRVFVGTNSALKAMLAINHDAKK